ncbi:MAG: hypothetical protein JWL59_238 [Chthoniobacteraceae bacterium]|nr:hypothetical protein [Chthoniobacteraceae bacterium]
MAKSDYVPTGDGAFMTWHDQMLKEARQNGPADGLTAKEIAALEANNSAIHSTASEAEATAAAAQRATAAKRAAFKNAEAQARGVAASIKGRAVYDESKGKGYGIVGQEHTVDLTIATPVLDGETLPHGAALLRYQRGDADGINLYCARGTAPMELLRFISKTEFIDKRPLLVPGTPELRTYEAIFVKDDEEVGQRSAAVSVACRL